MVWEFDQALYHNRNFMEKMFSILKENMGKKIRSNKHWNQVKEIKNKVVSTKP